jgi:hypothetical protein
MDDYSFAPISPSLEMDIPEEVEETKQAERQDARLAKAYFHPNWEGVEQFFEERLEALAQRPDSKLPAEEYKIESLANQKAETIIKDVWIGVKNAVTAVNESEREQGAK